MTTPHVCHPERSEGSAVQTKTDPSLLLRMTTTGNILADLPDATSSEVFQSLVERNGIKIERIISHGQATPEGEWYDQEWDEWVLVLSGQAHLLIEGETQPRELKNGDHLLLPAHCRHRVEWTPPDTPTIWLAVHFGAVPGTV
jgi:cupin 2 domain-containing protein